MGIHDPSPSVFQSPADIRLLDILEDSLRDQVVGPLGIYNREKNGLFFARRELPENAAKPLNVVAFDSDGKCIGGLIGETQFKWLHIDFLAVHSSSREKGIGSKLMAAAEKEGIARGCKYAWLDTMSYQAPKFYEKLGYSIAGEIKDWDSHGNTKYFFMKTLAVESL